MNKPRVLLSGGTGFLGKQILPLLNQWAEVDIISRSGKTSVKGDLSLWDGGMDLELLTEKKYAAFIHLAGLYDLTAERDAVLLNNVVATSNALAVAQKAEIPIFVNASSIASATNILKPSVSPYDLSFTTKFPDYYAESKALGEQLLINWSDGVPSRLNLRFGILIGDSIEGKIERIDGPYHTPQVMKKIGDMLNSWGKMMIFPGNEKVHLPLVPVNQAAAAANNLIKWMFEKQMEGYKSFHLSPQEGLSVRGLYSSTLKHLNLSNSFLLTHHLPETLITKIGHQFLGFPEEQVRYALDLPNYDSTDTRLILGDQWCSEFSEYETIFWSGYEKFISNC